MLASAGGQQTQDVGGATGISFAQLAIHGGRRFDQTLQINGMSITNLDNESITTINFTDGNIQEMVMDVAAQSAESELGGVRVNIIPKDGGNTFRGSLAANFSNAGLQADNYTDDLQRPRAARAEQREAPVERRARVRRADRPGQTLVLRSVWNDRHRELRGRHVRQHDAGGMDADVRPERPGGRRPDDARRQHPAHVAGDREEEVELLLRLQSRLQLPLPRLGDALARSCVARGAAESSESGHLDDAGDQPAAVRDGGFVQLAASRSRAARQLDQPTIVEQSNGLGYRAISTAAVESLVYLHQDVRNYNFRGSAPM